MAALNVKEQQQHREALRLEVKKRSDRLMNFFLAAYFLGGLALAPKYDTWSVALGVGGLSLIAYYSVKLLLPKSNLYQYVLSVILAIFMAQYIYQMHGLFEMHFIAFIGSAILITYQDWKLQIPMAALVVVHHGVFGYLQDIGFNKIYFTQLNSFELWTFIIHVILAAIIFFVCGLWGYLLNKYSERQVNQTLALAGQQSIAESNKRFTYAAQATSDAIWDRQYEDNSCFWGEGFRLLFGYDINEETNSIKFWESKIHPSDKGRVIATILEAKADPAINSWKCEYRFLKANDEYAFVKEKAIMLRDEKGELIRSIGALQDVTESKKAEILLKELNEDLEKEKYFLDSLMDNMPDSIYFKDTDSKFIRVSKFMADRFGTTVDQLIGKTDFDFQDKDHAKSAYDDEMEILQTKKPKIDFLEKEILEGGAELWVSTTKMPLINARGEVVGTFGMSRDVTNIKSLEEERHSALLDKAVAQGKFEIASGVMHDIGNAVVGFGSYVTRIRRLQDSEKTGNLRSLAGFFEEQKDSVTNALGEAKANAVIKMLHGLAETQKNNHEEIGKTITEQLNIINHIQEILNIQRQYVNGYESQERNPVNIKSIINDSLSMLFASIDKANIEVVMNIPADVPIIKGDRTKLMQVMLNILKNSIEAMDPKSETKGIDIYANHRAGKLMLMIKDTGRGFGKDATENLFKRGYTTKSSGTGLGLYNCRSIIESHEGTIAITSNGEGKGAITTISFKI